MDRKTKLCLAMMAVVVGGCHPPLPKDLSEVLASNQPAKPKARVTNRPANTKGRTLILEYHKLSGRNTQLDRTPEKFRSDLESLYKAGFRPVTVSEWLGGHMDLAPGASPVILTFDDATPSQFKVRKDGSVDPKCFVGIWANFAETHPDFPVHGTFFILPPEPFGQAKFVKQKVQMLQRWGSEVASHTWHHLNLTKCDDATVRTEIGTSLDWLAKEFGVTRTTLAFPYGNKPRNMQILQEFRGRLFASFVAAGNPAEQPSSPDFDPWRIPRVVVGDHWGDSTSWIKDMKTSTKFAPYVAP